MALLARLLWPNLSAAAPVAGASNLDAAAVVGLAFASLVAERMMSAFPPARCPRHRDCGACCC